MTRILVALLLAGPILAVFGVIDLDDSLTACLIPGTPVTTSAPPPADAPPASPFPLRVEAGGNSDCETAP